MSARAASATLGGLARLKTHPPKEIAPVVIDGAAVSTAPDGNEISIFLGAQQRNLVAGGEEYRHRPRDLHRQLLEADALLKAEDIADW